MSRASTATTSHNSGSNRPDEVSRASDSGWNCTPKSRKGASLSQRGMTLQHGFFTRIVRFASHPQSSNVQCHDCSLYYFSLQEHQHYH
eukprot:scaffold453107_cov51-Attheya_sp.AAC.1